MLRIAFSTLAGAQGRHARRVRRRRPGRRARRLLRDPARLQPAGADSASSGSQPPRSSYRPTRRSARAANVSVLAVRAAAAAGRRSRARLQTAAGDPRRPSPTARSAHAGHRRARACARAGATESAAVGHGWESAALTPFALASGHAPRSAGEIVVDARACAARFPSARRPPSRRDRHVASRASPSPASPAARTLRHRLTREAPIFFRDDVARRLSGTGDRADLIAIVARARRGCGRRREASAQRARPARTARPDRREARRGGVARGAAQPRGHRRRADRLRRARGVRRDLRGREHVRALGAAAPPRARPLPRDRQHAAPGAPDGRRRGPARLARRGRARGADQPARRAPRAGPFTRAGMVPEGLHIVVGWLPFAAGLVAAIVTTQLAAFASARRASRIRPTDALRESSRPALARSRGPRGSSGSAAARRRSRRPDRRLGSGARQQRPGGGMVLDARGRTARAAAGAGRSPGCSGCPLAALSRGPGMLARANTRANLRRVASVATPLMLAVSLVCTIFFGKSALAAADDRADRRSARRPTTFSARGTSAACRRTSPLRRARLPGVAAGLGLPRHHCDRGRRRHRSPLVPGARRRRGARSPRSSISASHRARSRISHGAALAVARRRRAGLRLARRRAGARAGSATARR